MRRESALQREIRLALGRDRRVVLWRNSSGVAETANGGRQRFGLCVGSSDLIGILKPSGRFIALEIKTSTGRLSKEQELFIQLVRRMGGVAEVVRSVEEAKNAIERANRE